jgi:hypothetical protein
MHLVHLKKIASECLSLLSFADMIKIKEILLKIFFLLLEILLFTLETGMQVVLPTRKRKGNILSSILNFFVGIVERINDFEYGFFKMNNVLKHKYIKQVVIIVGTFLFLLSSFEWTNGRSSDVNNVNVVNTYMRQLLPIAEENKTDKEYKQAPHIVPTEKKVLTCCSSDAGFSPCIFTHPSAVKKYLLFCNILI